MKSHEIVHRGQSLVLLPLSKVANEIGYSDRTLMRWIQIGTIPTPFSTPHRKWFSPQYAHLLREMTSKHKPRRCLKAFREAVWSEMTRQTLPEEGLNCAANRQEEDRIQEQVGRSGEHASQG